MGRPATTRAGDPHAADKPTRRQAAKARTRQRILDTARAHFAAAPYEAVTMRGLARAAGMSTGAVFGNFRDKADLWREAMGGEPPIDDPAARLRHRRMARALELIAGADFWTDDTGVEMTLLARWALGDESGGDEQRQAVRDRFEIYYAAGRQEGFVTGDPADLAKAEIAELSDASPF